jgi:hypothetical protein
MKKLNKHMNNLITVLKEDGILFSFDQEIAKNGKRLENIIFEKDDVQYKIYEGVILRDFGQCKYFKKIKGDAIVLVDYTDTVFYEEQRDKILKYFEINEKI